MEILIKEGGAEERTESQGDWNNYMEKSGYRLPNFQGICKKEQQKMLKLVKASV
jgi:hypothetical protein